MTNVDEILTQRGKTYGDYEVMCKAIRAIKDAIQADPGNYHDLDAYQQEALDMFATKIGRILTGDPDYADNWDDIAGYAKCVSARLPFQGG